MELGVTHRRADDSDGSDAVALVESRKSPIINFDRVREEKQVQSLWTPIFLTRPSLICFLVAFLACIVTLAVLYADSDRNQGLTSTDESLHYVWTYGPTAIFTLLSALWGQVDFRTKQLMPWKILLQGPASARNTLFLDYISSWDGFVLCSSLRRKHFPVSLSVSGTLLIKLLIVVSTGLFSLRLVTVHDYHAALTTLDKFNGDGFSRAVIDSGPFSMLYSIQKYGSRYPLGTTDQYAYQMFNTSGPHVAANTTLIGEVDALHAPFTCRVLLDNVTVSLEKENYDIITKTVQVDPETQLTITDDDIQISTSDCKVSIYRWDNAWQTLFTSCDGRESVDAEYDPEMDEMMSKSRDRESLLFHVIISKEDEDTADSQKSRLTAVYCDMNYAIIRANLTIDNPLDPVVNLDTSDSSRRPKRELPGVSKFDVLNALRMAVANMTMEARPRETMPDHWQRSSNFFTVLNSSVAQPQDSNWLDGDRIKQAAELSLSPLVAQIAKQYLLRPSEVSFVGERTYTEYRLVMQDLSFGLIQGILGLMFLIGAALFFLAPRAVCSKDPGSIASLATILSASPELNRAFEETGAHSTKMLERTAARGFYQSSVQVESSGVARFKVDITEGTNTRSEGVEQKVQWWRPFSSTFAVQTLLFLGPAGLIIALEILFEQSQRNEGIADVGPNPYLPYTWTYIPAVTMFAVSMIYGLLDFGARVFQPYSLLRRRAVAAAPSIFNQQLGKITIKCFFDSLRQFQAATAATSLAVMIAGLLPVAASGLYTVRNVPRLTPIEAHVDDSFNFMSYGGSNVPLSRSDLILNSNMSYPQWTYKDLAFPSLTLFQNDTMQTQEQSSTVSVSVPAVRGKSNCTALEPEKIQIIQKQHGVHVNLSLPDVCLQGSGTYKPYEALVDFKYSYFGRLLETQTLHPDKCPTITIISGYADNKTSPTANVLLCRPYFESIETNLTLKLPSLELDLSHPPVTLEDTAKVIKSANNYSEVVPSDYFTFSYSEVHPPNSPYKTDYDGLLSTMAYGLHGTPPPELVGEDNIPRLQDAFQYVYGVAQAQRVSWQFREKKPPNPATVTAMLHNPHRTRLVQSAVSTHLLAAFLGTMMMCAVVAFFAIDTRRTLPKNPCTIGGQVSLLAGSEMLGENVFPAGSEWCSDKELMKRGVFGGWLFSMGWWKGGRFGIGIGHAEQEK